MVFGLLAATLISLSIGTVAFENINVVEKEVSVMSISRVSVKSSGWMNYLNKIVRIESVKTEAGDVIFERGMISPYKKEIILPAPEKYRIKLLCERPIKLSKQHPEVDLEVNAQCNYVIDCEDVDGKMTPVVNSTCKY